MKTVNALTLHGQSIGDGITMSEWTFNLTTNNGPILWNEVLRRRWQNGKVVSERYYAAPRHLEWRQSERRRCDRDQ